MLKYYDRVLGICLLLLLMVGFGIIQEEEAMYEFQIALELMRDARRYGVTKHVLQTARKYREQNATASLSDCIWEGYCEWVK